MKFDEMTDFLFYILVVGLLMFAVCNHEYSSEPEEHKYEYDCTE